MRIQSTIEAECRAVEEGHRAFAEGRRFRVVSDETTFAYRVTVSAVGDGILFSCNHPQVRFGAGLPAVGAPGETACKHAAVVARRLQREGHAEWTDRGWRLTDSARQAVEEFVATDPFERL